MDDESLAVPLHRDALSALGRINALSFAARSLWNPLSQFAREAASPIRVLDLACGGGDVLLSLSQKAASQNLPITFAGCDKSDIALNFAREQAQRAAMPADFFPLNILEENIPAGFDVIINSLFLHHFDPIDVTTILSKMAQAQFVLVSDLRRSRAGLMLAYLAGYVLSRSPVVRVDGPRSVRAAYTIPEMLQMARDAGMPGAQIERRWPCRMLLKWQR